MKLAQALTERAELQRHLEQLSSRLMMNARVQEGEQPAEQPNVLLAQLEQTTAQLEALITRINLTNAAAQSEGESLTALLARRDCLKQKVGILRNFAAAASATVVRGTRTEIKIKSTVTVAELQKQIDDLSRDLRQLEGRIQELNWTTELV